MRAIAPEKLNAGMVVATSVYHTESASPLPLIGAGVVITDKLRAKLLRSDVRSVIIDDEYSRGIELEQAISDNTRMDATIAIRDAFDIELPTTDAGGVDVTEMVPALSHWQVSQVGSAMQDIMLELLARRGLVTGLSDLDRFGGDRLQRAVNVSVLGMALGRRYLELWGWRDYKGNLRRDQFDERMRRLGIGLILADVGLAGMPTKLWETDPLELSPVDMKVVLQHPARGMNMMREAFHNPSSLASVTIMQHHERADGSGYPKGLKNEEMHDHGLIAGVADTYISLTGAGMGDPSTKRAPHEAYQEVLDGRGTLFDEKVVGAFEETVAPYSPGATVLLTDGSHAIVTRHTRRPLEPEVRVTHGPDGVPLDPFRELELGDGLYIQDSTDGLPGDGVPQSGAA